MAKVMVTGGKGLIGTQVVNALRESESEHQVVTFDLKDGQDILSRRGLVKMLQIHQPQVVVHLAAHPHPSTALQYRDYVDVNVLGTFNVAEACLKAGISRLIYSSSTAYYGYEHTIGRPLPIGDEQSIPGIRWAKPRKDQYLPCELWYGISKVCCETLLAYYGLSQHYQVIILRFAPVPHHIDLGLKPEEAAEAVRLAVEYPGELWYEVFNMAGEPGLDIGKAKDILGFSVDEDTTA